MVYLACDKDGTERIFEDVPHRQDDCYWDTSSVSSSITLPHGFIKKCLGKELSWQDNYAEL